MESEQNTAREFKELNDALLRLKVRLKVSCVARRIVFGRNEYVSYTCADE